MTRTFVVYILVGILNTAVGYALFAFFIFLRFSYPLAVLFGTILAVLFNFRTIGRIVFKSSDNSLIFRFFAVYGITYGLNVAGLWLLKRVQPDMYLAGALLLLPMAVVSFVLHRNFVFTTHQR